ncbi:hypothetical protein BH11PLA2_BH11PLA2_05360 [soil metagenome]
MAFATRCPECSAKLAFDEAPDVDEAIECPRCGHKFDAAEAKPEQPKKKKRLADDDDKPRKPKGPKKKKSTKNNAPKARKIKQRKSNPFLLWMMIIGALVVAPAVGWVFFKLFFSTGKIGQLMAYVPPECNLMRGVDCTRMAKYPGYEEQLKTVMRGPFEECQEAFAKAAGVPVINDKKQPYLDYAMCAKNKRGNSGGVMYVLQTRDPVDAKKLFVTGLGASEQSGEGGTYYRIPGTQPGVLANALAYVPTEKVIVLIANEKDAQGMLRASFAAKANPKETSIMPKLGATGNKVSRGNIWLLMRPDGDLNQRLDKEVAAPIKGALSTLSQKVSTTKMFGVYIFFGTSVKYGVAMECESREAADSLVKSMKESAMGKQDDSEVPRDLKQAFPPAHGKEFFDFLSTLYYFSYKECAYLEAKMALDKSNIMLGYFNKPDMFNEPFFDPTAQR